NTRGQGRSLSIDGHALGNSGARRVQPRDVDLACLTASAGRSRAVELHKVLDLRVGAMHDSPTLEIGPLPEVSQKPLADRPSVLRRRPFMSRHILAVGLVSTLFAADGCNAPEPLGPSIAAPEFARPPADGNGNKQVFVIDINDHVSCGTQTLARNIGGWVQVRLFGGAGNRGVELDVFHSLFTFTNSAGATFVWRDVGPDRYWI